ncbi:MAG: hypothetical protein JXB62_15650 [Pirellulales bacterium]|nr:hypothetical protein [Pirellulales bacterium]
MVLELAVVMFLRYTFDSPIVREEDHGFIRHYDVDVFGFGEDGEHLIGKVAFDIFLWGDAEVAGADLFEICDADSQGWCDVFCALSGRETFGGGGRDEILPELGIEDVVDRITFVWRFLLHPEARTDCTKAVVQDIARYVGIESILTTWHGTLEMPDSDLVDVGFSKVGGTTLVFRDLHLQAPYAARHPLGEEIDFDARPEHEEWVLKQWKT